MEKEENDDDEHLTESELGTKAYWEDFYQTELENFVDSGDQGETWFGRRNTNMIIQWIADNVPKAGKCFLMMIMMMMITFTDHHFSLSP